MGGVLHVHFMAVGHVGRPASWGEDRGAYGFPHTFWRDVGPTFGPYRMHFNPAMICHLLSDVPDVLVLGGVWDSISSILLSLLGSRHCSVGWLEGNTRTPGLVRGFVGSAKRLLLIRHNLLAVPGSDGAAYIDLLFLRSLRRSPYLTLLPNIVDEEAFIAGVGMRDAGDVMMRSWGVSSSDRVALWPARSIPAKGIIPFLHVLSEVRPLGWKIVLIGEGPLADEIGRMIVSLGLERTVLQRRYVDYGAMPALYSRAQLFLLPSLHDPNPLSVVEAMHSGLPLLISDRLGNFPEALEVGGNGWVLRLDDHEAVRAETRRAFSARPEELKQRGELSRQRAAIFWSSRKVTSSLARCLMELSRHASGSRSI
jgi:glycosyltransferase involved in cell wall biosynthesis